jgi:hypothetical protein
MMMVDGIDEVEIGQVLDEISDVDRLVSLAQELVADLDGS